MCGPAEFRPERHRPSIGEVDDVLASILVRLPLKALLRCKLVCRRWRHLVSDPVFVSGYSRRHARLRSSGFYLQRFLFYRLYSSLKFVSCDPPEEAPTGGPSPCSGADHSLANLIEDENGVFVRHSCNGLLLCSSFRCHEDDRIYYICTPPTRQFLPLPSPDCRTVFGINVAFDPAKALYRLVCVADSEVSARHRQILVCSSHFGGWRKSGKPFPVSDELLFNRGVFWNGGLHWIGRGRSSLRFHVKDEVLMEMAMPPVREGWSERKLGYFGESGGHLYLVEIYGSSTTAFDVMEMARDYSGWFVKYHVDLEAVARDLARSLQRNVHIVAAYSFSVLHIVHRQVGEKEECFMVLRIPSKFVLYDLKKNTAMDIGDSMPQLKSIEREDGLKPPKTWIVKAWVLPEEDAPELYVKWANDWWT
ncbi:F-box protein At5g07610-like [Syzygium oleosum]|uniref:F-box protein At5g07610-like n=1 Tax=Syzygium oleosum TaxID=219896 RepID=UPI0011D23C6E|nr:F-box protein At5g07610-like [Syzygium oleosum]